MKSIIEKHIWTVLVLSLASIVAVPAYAQQAPPTETRECIGGEKVASLDQCLATYVELGVGLGSIKGGVGDPVGTVGGQPFFAPASKGKLYLFGGGWTREEGFGLQAPGSFFKGASTDTITSSNQVLGYGGVDIKPIVVSSTPPPLFSPVELSGASNWMIQRFEVEATVGVPFCYGETTLFAGLAWASFQNERTEAQLRQVFLEANLPNGQRDTNADLKKLYKKSVTTTEINALGFVIGAKIESQSFGPGLHLEARGAESIAHGTPTLNGRASAHEDVFVVPTASGFAGTGPSKPGPADTATSFPNLNGDAKNISITDLEAFIGFRHRGFQASVGIVYARYGNVPLSVARWIVKPNQDFQFGSWQDVRVSTTTLSFLAPMAKVAVRF